MSYGFQMVSLPPMAFIIMFGNLVINRLSLTGTFPIIKNYANRENCDSKMSFYYYPPSYRTSSCVRTIDTVICLHTWCSLAM